MLGAIIVLSGLWLLAELGAWLIRDAAYLDDDGNLWRTEAHYLEALRQTESSLQ